MPSFKKKCYTNPVICLHNSDLSKDWYVFFRFKNDGKVHAYKRREGINRIEELSTRITAIEELRDEIEFDLTNGWNPIIDPKRELEYSPFLKNITTTNTANRRGRTKKQNKEDLFQYFLNK
jgi:hypothetical protein